MHDAFRGDKIFKGTKPGNLPILFILQSPMLRADRVIECSEGRRALRQRIQGLS